MDFSLFPYEYKAAREPSKKPVNQSSIFMKTFSRSVLALCACVLLNTATATTVIPPSFDELVAQAELIFQGTVTDVKSQWVGEGGQRHIVSYVTLRIDEAIKGDPGKSYTMQMLGGTVGDDTKEVSDSPRFKVGDRDILFVEHNGTQFIPIVGIMHGRFRLEQDKSSGGDVVRNDKGVAVSDLAKLGQDEQTEATPRDAGKPLRSADFKAAIRAKLSARNP